MCVYAYVIIIFIRVVLFVLVNWQECITELSSVVCISAIVRINCRVKDYDYKTVQRHYYRIYTRNNYMWSFFDL